MFPVLYSPNETVRYIFNTFLPHIFISLSLCGSVRIRFRNTGILYVSTKYYTLLQV